ncbi:MAG TPA: hypothetical protein VH372_20850 [Actinospica sp.]|jgi:hypothetical protein|nr:hypothetical protein [Actinospica sp.]
MATELMAGYTAYTNAPDIIAEAVSGAVDPDEQSISVTVSVTYSWTTTYYAE